MRASIAVVILILAAGVAQSVALALPAFKFERPQLRPAGPRLQGAPRPHRPQLSMPALQHPRPLHPNSPPSFVNQHLTPSAPLNTQNTPPPPPAAPNASPPLPPAPPNTPKTSPPAPPNTPNTPPPPPPAPPSSPNTPNTMNTHPNTLNTPPITTTPPITPSSSPPSTPETTPPRTPQDLNPWLHYIQERELLKHVNQRIRLVARARVGTAQSIHGRFRLIHKERL